MRASSCASILLALPLMAAPVEAQRGIEINPVLGYYRPIGNRFDDPNNVVAAGLPIRPADLKGVALGGEARLWVFSHLGLQVQAGTAASMSPEVATPGGCCEPMPVRVSTFTAQALLGLRLTRRSRLWLGAGPAAVRHGGEGYARFGSPTFRGASVGAGLSVRVRSGLRATASAGTVLYHYEIDAPPAWGPSVTGIVQSGFRKDLLVSMGLGWGRP